jgi:hypothetical protein
MFVQQFAKLSAYLLQDCQVCPGDAETLETSSA